MFGKKITVQTIVNEWRFCIEVVAVILFGLVGWITATIALFIVYKFGTGDGVNEFGKAIQLFGFLFIITTLSKLIFLFYDKNRGIK